MSTSLISIRMELKMIRVASAILVALVGISLIVYSLVDVLNGSPLPEHLILVVGLALFTISTRIAWPMKL